MSLPPGTTLGTIRLERMIGRGGMGEVYLATDTALGRRVAVKVLPPELAADERFRRRFLAESRLAASLDHPHIVPVYDAGERDGRLVLVMRYVEGEDLGSLLARDGALTAPAAVGLLRGIGDALDVAHAQGLVHRDVKPSNILVARGSAGGRHAYLADFGLVKQLGSSLDLSIAGGFVGSIGYVAPEEIEGASVDGRSDLYSLTCVLFECLTGRPPFANERDVATLWAHLNAARPRPSEHDPALSPFDAVIARGMAVAPDDRYPSAAALMADADAALGAAPEAPMAAEPSPAVSGRRSRAVAAAVSAALVIAVGAFGVSLANRPGGAANAPSISAPSISAPSGSSAAIVAPSTGLEPPGEWIAYERRAADPAGLVHCSTFAWTAASLAAEIRAVRPDSIGDRRVLAPGDLFEHEPAWMPDGRLAFVGAGTGTLGVSLVRGDGSGLESLTDGEAFIPVQRPVSDARGRIAWIQSGDHGDLIGILDSPTADVRTITPFLAPANKEDPPTQIGDISWAPDGRLAIVSGDQDPDDAGLLHGALSTIRPDGTGLQPVPLEAEVGQVAWSPDGSRLALTVRVGDRWRIGVLPIGGELSILNAEPGGAWTDRDPAWSPDGTRIAFASDRTGRFEINTMGADGSDVKELTTTEPTRASCAPSWSRPDVTLPPIGTVPSAGPAEIARGWLPGGRVRAAQFDPPFEITIPAPDDLDPSKADAAWQAWQAGVDDVWFRRLTPAPWVDLDIGRVTVAHPDGCITEQTQLAPSTARDLIETLQALPLVEVSEIRPVEVGGASGIQVDLAGLQPPADCPATPNRIFLFETANGHLFVRPGERLRLIAVDASDRVIVITGRADDGSLTGLASPVAERLYASDLQPIIDSITFDRP